MSKKAAMTSLAQGLQPQVSCHPAQLALRKATQGSTHWLAYQGDLADLVRLPVHARPVIPTSVMWRQGNRLHCLARLCFVRQQS